MAQHDGKPVWYVAGSEGWHDIIKHGTTRNVSSRKNPYVTSNPYLVHYINVFILDDTVLERRGLNLYTLDSVLFPRWLDRMNRANTRCNYGGGTEFYKHADPLAIVREFMAFMNIPILEEISDDSQFPLHASSAAAGDTEASREATAKLAWEDCERTIQKREALKQCLKHRIDMTRFLNTFIPGKELRKHQVELWRVWETILSTVASYKGIIQWPTGTGKTFAMLILILLTAQFQIEKGEIYRGILVAPKNDILDSIMKHIHKLSAFGIKVLEGHRGKYSSLVLPTNQSYVLVVTHAALADDAAISRLSGITHVHYDEVHRITGDEFFGLLKTKLQEWGTNYITGTSATPKTSNVEQQKKIAELFGDPLEILHRAELDEMVALGYIAHPRFHISQIPPSPAEVPVDEFHIHYMIEQIRRLIAKRQNTGQWRGGKAILYFDTLSLVNAAYRLARDKLPSNYKLYAALDSMSAETSDKQFVEDPADGTPRILFACEKYREGADIDGMEITQVLMGKTMAAYILVQIIGRAIRADYAGKEGWCCIMRPQYEDDGDTSALEHILFDLDAVIQNKSGKLIKTDFKEFVQKYFGDVQVDGRTLDLDETLTRVQQMYLRRHIEQVKTISMKDMQEFNKEIGLKSRKDYYESKDKHPHFIENPQVRFGIQWHSWYNFLGVDVSNWAPTKSEWREQCIVHEMTTWETYKAKITDAFPPNPSEMYPDFTNWDDEFPTDNEW
jgi:superfamily II DNA or RNA helicase